MGKSDIGASKRPLLTYKFECFLSFREAINHDFPFISVIDDIDFENVGERNSLEGDCVPEDVDLDGFIAEWEITCFV